MMQSIFLVFMMTIFVANNNCSFENNRFAYMPKSQETDKQYLDRSLFTEVTPNYYPTMTYFNNCAFIPDYRYFWNLNDNFATNANGECTWIALEIFISYLEVVKNGYSMDNG